MAALTPRANALPAWQRRGVFASMSVLAASGLAWLALHYTLGVGAGELPHPLEPWLLKLHGAATFAGLFCIGLVAAQHVARGWRLRRRRASGVVLLAGLGLLALSGYALYYFAPEAWRAWIGNAHALVGVVATVAMARHAL